LFWAKQKYYLNSGSRKNKEKSEAEKNSQAKKMPNIVILIKNYHSHKIIVRKKRINERYLLVTKFSHRVPAAALRGYPASFFLNECNDLMFLTFFFFFFFFFLMFKF
jgi:hypothetical protein